MNLLFWLQHPYTSMLARWILALVFLISAWGKLPDRQRFVFVVLAYRVLPRPLAHIYAFLLPWVEVLVGGMLLIGFALRISAVLSCGLLLSFTIAIGLNVARRRTDMDCGCMGPHSHQKISSKLLLRNAFLILLSVLVLFTHSTIFSIDPDGVLLTQLISGSQIPAITLICSTLFLLTISCLCIPLLRQMYILWKNND